MFKVGDKTANDKVTAISNYRMHERRNYVETVADWRNGRFRSCIPKQCYRINLNFFLHLKSPISRPTIIVSCRWANRNKLTVYHGLTSMVTPLAYRLSVTCVSCDLTIKPTEIMLISPGNLILSAQQRHNVTFMGCALTAKFEATKATLH
jgi:hypothetical protein